MYKKNNKICGFLALFLALVLSVACAVPVYATEETETISVHVIQADTEKELFETFSKISDENIAPRAALITVGIARNYSTGKNCEVFLNWTGTARYNGWRFKKLEITNGSAQDEELYDSIGAGAYITYNVNSASTGTVSLGTVQIPTSVSKVYVDFTGLQGSLSANSDWNSVVNPDHWVDIT